MVGRLYRLTIYTHGCFIIVVDEDLMDCDHPEHPQGHYSAEVDFVRGITEPPGPATFSRDRLLLECRELRKEIIENMRRKEVHCVPFSGVRTQSNVSDVPWRYPVGNVSSA
jgi:hypothetical protein